MGLNVKVFENVEITLSDDYDFIANVIDENWNDRIKNLQKGERYKGERLKSVGLSYPYSMHNEFRDQLCRLIGFNSRDWRQDNKIPENTPFYEFFEFADNDGCIDWKTSEELYKDFKFYEILAINKLAQFNMVATYLEWLQIFDSAKQVGSVIVYS